ncbi:hypothetical protein Ocin01_00759 [Orchesella cincta]|uniref:XK-related protein n=1 Tax=Orchesella cincta TaxID=48709 RepID=A0A1D2NL08_ORCCI|nr:hypothetical protein Ocin01_00759 [Orchesella cincta]
MVKLLLRRKSKVWVYIAIGESSIMVNGTVNVNHQSPLLDKGSTSSASRSRHEMQEVQRNQQHHHQPSRAYIIIVDLINLLMTALEIALVLYLSIHHFTDSMGVIAVAMLAPIALNFIGVTFFFSDKNERDEFEKVGTTRLTKDMFQIPVFGPVLTALKVLLISSGLSKRGDIEYERFEASAVKMRQAQTFFSASPEAVIQLSVLLISRSNEITVDLFYVPNSYDYPTLDILETAIVIVSIFTLAESNVYALRSPYFRLFHTYEDGDWTVHETFGRKCILFFHSFFSIGSRIAASACLIAGIQCFRLRMIMRPADEVSSTSGSPTMVHPNDQESAQELGYMIAFTLICLIFYHMIVYYIARFLRFALMGKGIPGGCYESINYGWRSTILHTGFQSKNIATQIWFYLENCIMISVWWFTVETYGDPRVKRNSLKPMTVIFICFAVLSVFFLFAAVGTKMHSLRNPLKNPQHETIEAAISK